MKKIIIAIDGYSGTGKSSTAKEVAKRLGYAFIDTGAMYRAVTYYMWKNDQVLSNEAKVVKLTKELSLKFPEGDDSSIYLNGELLQTELRIPEVNDRVSDVAAITEVRREMVRQQKLMGLDGGLVMDGRDIGTIVFPDAELKIFMTASNEVRAQRRLEELKEQGVETDFESIFKNLKERDIIDSSRSEGPLRKSEGAVEINTTELTFEDQVEQIVVAAKRIIHEN